MTLSRVVSEIVNVKKVMTLKSGSMSLKVVSFDRLGMVSYQCSIVTTNFVPKMHRF